MRDILIDGVPILDLLEITGSTSRVATLSNCDQSSVSRLYRHASEQLGLDFRKSQGRYRAHANQAVLRSLRHTAQLLRLARGSRQLQRLGHFGSPLPQEWLAEERSLELLRERVLDLAVLADPNGLAPTWSDHSQPFPFGDWVVVGLTRAAQPLRPAAVVLRHDNLEQPALQELIGQLRTDVLRTDVLRMEHRPFARVDALDVCHDLPPLLATPIAAMRAPVSAGLSRSLAWRLEQLDRLAALLRQHEAEVLEALAADLGKPPLEATFELIAVRQELALTRRKLKGWMAPRAIGLDLALRPGQAWVQAEPLGCVLIIGPWNYPFQLCLHPLVSALAAGNAAVLKPSEHAPRTAELLARAIPAAFPAEVVQVVTGDGAVAAKLLEEQFDHIFFTGGGRVGRLVMAAAARHLTPVTLELGGKSPAIVLADADIATTARRLAWGKGLNAGQTCIAPDHVLVQAPLQGELVAAIASEWTRFYGADPLASDDLGCIVSDAQFQRLEALLAGARQRGQVLVGGRSDAARRRIEPTVVAVASGDDPLMQEELFGPILPVQQVADLDAALVEVRSRPKPLALYLFSPNRSAQERTLTTTSSGGVGFNDVVLQAGAAALPFGGVGESGMGSYHGHTGFLTFSHQRTVLRRPFWLDLPFRYPPYAGKLGLVKRLLG